MNSRYPTYKAVILFVSIILIAGLSLGKEWTVMVYIAADNNLSSFVNGDVDEMESAGSNDYMDIVCQIDGLVSSWYNGYDDYLGDNHSTVRRYHIQPGNSSNNSIDAGFISDLGELNTEDPNTLRDFVNWTIDNYPSDRYMLVIWNHGGGWSRPAHPLAEKAIVWDDTDGDGSGINFSNGEYANCLSQVRDHLGRSLNIIGFDACIVGLLENEYETMGYADYLVHSEANVPGDGWNYEFLQQLGLNPNASEEEICDWIVDEYSLEYSSDVTLSAVRLDHDHVNYQMAINDFARELILAGGNSNSSVSSAISSATDFGSDLVDVYDFADQIDDRNIGGAGSALDAAAIALKNAQGVPPGSAGKPLIATYQSGFSGSQGIAVYNPSSSASSSWSNLDIAECNLWDEFIGGSSSLPSIKLAYWGNSLGKYIETGSTSQLYLTARNLGSGTASSVTAILSSYDSRVTISGGPVSFNNISPGATSVSLSAFDVYIFPTVAESSFIPFEVTFNTGKTAKFVLTALGIVNYPPEIVDVIWSFDYVRCASGYPSLSWFVPNDPDGDDLHFEIQWDQDYNFSSPTTISSDISDIGFGPSVPRASGTGECFYIIGSQGESGMTDGETYWWRVRAKDEYHTGNWSSSRSITIDSSIPAHDWHQTLDEQFENNYLSSVSVESNQISLSGISTIFNDDFEYASESEAWSVWNTYDGGYNISITLEDRRQVSGTYSLRHRDRNTSAYGGIWQSFSPIEEGRAAIWAKIFNPDLGDFSEFLGLHDGTDYSSSFTTGLIVYTKADTLKFWDGSSNIVHTSMDSLWHYYEIEFDLAAGTSNLYIDGSHMGSYSTGSLTEIEMIAFGTKLLGNNAIGTSYWDDLELIGGIEVDSGVVIGQSVAFDWKPDGATSWGNVSWNQNDGDSIEVIVQYCNSGDWTEYLSAFSPGSTGYINITGLSDTDSVRLKAILYNRGESYPKPILYDWTVDWNSGSVYTEKNPSKPGQIEIHSNWPNPFNPVTNIEFELPSQGTAEISIYNLQGKKVFNHQEKFIEGLNSITFDGRDLPSGTYLCTIEMNGKSDKTKIVLMK